MLLTLHKVFEDIKAFWLCGETPWFDGESKKQPFAALSSTESEVIGYVDAVTIGESLQVVSQHSPEQHAVERRGLLADG